MFLDLYYGYIIQHKIPLKNTNTLLNYSSGYSILINIYLR